MLAEILGLHAKEPTTLFYKKKKSKVGILGDSGNYVWSSVDSIKPNQEGITNTIATDGFTIGGGFGNDSNVSAEEGAISGGVLDNASKDVSAESSYDSSLKIDIVKQVDFTYTQEVSSHPTEEGFEIHDHINNKPMEMAMTLGISSHPVTWMYANGRGVTKFSDGLAALKAIRDNKEEIAIKRPDKIFENLVMTQCTYSYTDETKSIIWVDCQFVEIRKVASQTTTIPENIVTASKKECAGETAKNAGNAGQQGVSNSNSGGSSSGNGESSGTSKSKSFATNARDAIKDKVNDIRKQLNGGKSPTGSGGGF